MGRILTMEWMPISRIRPYVYIFGGKALVQSEVGRTKQDKTQTKRRSRKLVEDGGFKTQSGSRGTRMSRIACPCRQTPVFKWPRHLCTSWRAPRIRGVMGGMCSPGSEGGNRAIHSKHQVCFGGQQYNAKWESVQSLCYHLHACRALQSNWWAPELGTWQMWWLGMGGLAQYSTTYFPAITITYWEQLQVTLRCVWASNHLASHQQCAWLDSELFEKHLQCCIRTQ